MSIDETENNVIGTWAGKNVLRLSWTQQQEYNSPSNMTVAHAVGGKFITFAYTWDHEGTPHEGLLLVGSDAKNEVANAAWVDSWHASAKPLVLTGAVDGSGAIDVRGTYEVADHPDWGWRIVIGARGGALRMVMYNVSPSGEEDLAVRADYKRRDV